MPELRLVIFDVDGTLVDSQAEIMAAMQIAFQAEGLAMPDRKTVLSIVGLSLTEAFAKLCPQSDGAQQARLVDAYKSAFMQLRADRREMGPLFPGALDALRVLQNEDHTFLAVATGKSRRGLDKLLERYELQDVFHSEQVADHHPSKPHPSMIFTALAETGVAPTRAVMLGDTTYDMEMGRAAGVKTIGVTWGYHDASSLRPDMLLDDFKGLSRAVDTLIGV